jgi:hypothetical protein
MKKQQKAKQAIRNGKARKGKTACKAAYYKGLWAFVWNFFGFPFQCKRGEKISP